MGFGKPSKPVSEGPPVRTAEAAGLIKKLIARLSHPKIGKRRLELVTAAAEDAMGLSKSILVDDLNSGGLVAVKSTWAGPGVILETSPGNYQAILILSHSMNRNARKSITDQMVQLAGGDKGAMASGQLHRLPLSVNYKSTLDQPFACRVVEYFTGHGEGVKPFRSDEPALSLPVSTVRRGAVRPKSKRRWNGPASSESEEAEKFRSGKLYGRRSAL